MEKSFLEEDVKIVRDTFSHSLAKNLVDRIQRLSGVLINAKDSQSRVDGLKEVERLNEDVTYWLTQRVFLEEDRKNVLDTFSRFMKSNSWIYRAIKVDDSLVVFGYNFGEAQGIIRETK
jgi:hypothetical protein